MPRYEYSDDDALMHYGVLGMKWGVRKDGAPQGAEGWQKTVDKKGPARKAAKAEAKAAKKQEKADTKQWRKDSQSAETGNKVVQEAARRTEETVKALKNNATFKDLSDPGTRRQYDAAVTAAFNQHMINASFDETERNGRAFIWSMHPSGMYMQAQEYKSKPLKHEDSDGSEYRVDLTRDEQGYVTGFGKPKKTKKTVQHEYSDEDALFHYGVLGMKWGVRKDGKPQGYQGKQNPNYTRQQRKRDSQVYGKRGSKRINKAMNKGDNISTARGDEKTRRDRVMSKNKYVRQTGKVAGAAAGVAITNLLMNQVSKLGTTATGLHAVSKILNKKNPADTLKVLGEVTDFMNRPEIRIVASAGAAKIGQMMSGDIAVSMRMRAHGYDPNRR